MTMYLVGSGPADTLANVHDQFVESAKKRGTRVAVALLGSQDEVGQFLEGYTEPITSRWPEAEIVPVWLDDDPSDGQDTTVWPDDPESVAGLVVAGGWTPGYLEALRPHRDLLAKLVRRGTPYMGFSAGAMIVGKHAIVGGWKFRGRPMVPEVWGEALEELEVRDGLALIGPSVDVHSDVTSLGRAMSALERGVVGTVVAIDEGTCLVVDPVSGRTVVEGSQRVHWLTREDGMITVRHDSSAAELERHAGFLAVEKQAEERAAAERRELEERLAKQRAERLAAERAELDRQLAERQEQERIEAEERAERERVEAEKRAAEKAERDAIEAAERAEREKVEAAERAEREKVAAAERAEREAREAVERAEQDAARVEKEAEQERAAIERRDQRQAERQRRFAEREAGPAETGHDAAEVEGSTETTEDEAPAQQPEIPTGFGRRGAERAAALEAAERRAEEAARIEAEHAARRGITLDPDSHDAPFADSPFGDDDAWLANRAAGGRDDEATGQDAADPTPQEQRSEATPEDAVAVQDTDSTQEAPSSDAPAEQATTAQQGAATEQEQATKTSDQGEHLGFPGEDAAEPTGALGNPEDIVADEPATALPEQLPVTEQPVAEVAEQPRGAEAEHPAAAEPPREEQHGDRPEEQHDEQPVDHDATHDPEAGEVPETRE